MTPKIKIIPLGGLGEIGKNMTAFECGTDIIVVDCGLGFPDEQMYGIDIVIPDISYLKANADRIKGIILTHGHEDHIGAIPYVMSELDDGRQELLLERLCGRQVFITCCDPSQLLRLNKGKAFEIISGSAQEII